MYKEDKTKIALVFGYFISLFLFELIYTVLFFERDMNMIKELDNATPLVILTPAVKSGVYHFITVSIIAIFCKFSTKVSKEYKNLIYSFPLITFFISIPMYLPVAWVAGKFGVFNFML